MFIVFWREYVKGDSQATAKHKTHKLTFDPNTKSLADFFEELNDCAERAFGDNTQHMIDSLFYANLPLDLKWAPNSAYLKNVTYDQILARLEKELELSGLQNDGELSLPTMTAVPPKDKDQTLNNLKSYAITQKKTGHVNKNCRKRMKKGQEQINNPSN